MVWIKQFSVEESSNVSIASGLVGEVRLAVEYSITKKLSQLYKNPD